MTSRYHGSRISGSQQSFLTETTICIVERWKKSSGYRFVLECNYAQERHFSCHTCRTTVCRDPEIWLPWQCEVTTSPISIGLPFTDRSRVMLTLFSFATKHLNTHVLKRVTAAVDI